MKKSISLSAIILTATVILLSSLHVQAAEVVHDKNNRNGSTLSMPTVVTGESDVSAKTLKSFSRDFKIKVPVKWFSDEHYDLAYFVEAGIQYRISYYKSGRMFRMLKSYSVEHLDNNIKNKVEEAWDGYQITGITEVLEGSMQAYFVNIESHRKIKELVVYDQDMAVRRQFDKQ